MILLANLLNGIAVVLDMLLSFFILIVVVRALLSWVNPDPYNPLVRFLTGATDPLLDRIRKFMPRISIGMDFSPIILLAILFFIRVFVVQTLFEYAAQIKASNLHIGAQLIMPERMHG